MQILQHQVHTVAKTYYSGQPYNGETNPFPTESMLLATYIQNHLVSETNMYDRNAKHGGYIVLRRNYGS